MLEGQPEDGSMKVKGVFSFLSQPQRGKRDVTV